MGKRRRYKGYEQPGGIWRQEFGGMPLWGIVGGLALVVVMAVGAVALRPDAVSADPNRQPRPVPTFGFGTAQDATQQVVFIGDSYTAGAGASTPDKRWSKRVASELGWREVNAAIGGTGYALGNGEMCAESECGSYPDAIAGIPGDVTPGLIVVNGGRNDTAPGDDFRAGVARTFAALNSRFPGVPVAVTLPLGDDDMFPSSWRGDIVAEVAAANGVRVLDLGQPLAGRPDLLIDDSIHPNDAGYEAIASAFLAAWGSGR